jgi:hypothetical protein
LKHLILFLFTGLLTQFAFAQDALLLKTPTNNQVISGGDYFNISWESSNVDNIKIEYSSDGGLSWTTVINSYPSSASKYSWLVPAKPTKKGKIRISDIENFNIASVNPGNFTISEPSLKLDTDSTTSLIRGNPFKFGWKSQTVEKINIYYSINGGTDYTLIHRGYPSLAEAFTWIVPELNSSTIRLKIESADSSAISSSWNSSLISNPLSSNKKFLGGSFDGHSGVSNTSQKLSLLYPLGDETFAASSIQTLKWDSNNIEFIKIEFSADNGLNWLTVNDTYPANAKKLEWRVPSNLTSTGLIRISSVEDPTLKALNIIPFKIPLKSIAINTFENNYFVKDQPIPISWVNNGVDFLSIKYRENKGKPWKSITSSVSALMLNYIWIPPTTLITDSLEFKLSSTDSSVQDSSKTLLSIKPANNSTSKYKGGSYDGFSQVSNLKASIQILNPLSGLKLNGLTKTLITWKSENIEDIDIYLSVNNGKSWTIINKNYSANAKKYDWEIPATPTVSGLIKISSSNDSTINSVSGVFQIIDGFIKLTSGTKFNGDANSIIPISWTHSGVSKLNVYLKQQSLTNWTKIIDNYQADAGSFLFINKQELNGLFDIKVVSADKSLISDSISVNFERTVNTITPSKYKGGSYDGHAYRSNISKILVTKPQAGEVLVAGTKYLITWSTVNVSDSVKIEYTTDNGKNWKTISVAVDSKLGTYQWTVPGSAIPKTGQKPKQSGNFNVSDFTNECKIRISETGSQDEIVGLSNSTFSISSSESNAAKQTLIFNEIKDKTFGEIPFTISAIASSGLPITFSVISGPATISGNIITLTGAGTIIVKALQAGNANFKEVSAEQTFKALQATQTLNFKEIADKSFGSAPFEISATASSGLPVTFSIVSGPATIFGNKITLTGTGTVVVKAIQEGDTNYQSAQELRTFRISELPFSNFTIRTISSTCVSSDNGKIEIKAEKKLNYNASITSIGLNKQYSFTDSLKITNLKPGTYSLCITVDGIKDYVQCYELVITEPKELKTYISINRNTNFIDLTLAGSSSYTIELNGKQYKTNLSFVSFPLEKGNNNIKVYTDIPCQGVITKNIDGFSALLVYPSPFTDILKIDLREILSNSKIVITNIAGKTVYSGLNNDIGGILEINLTHLIPGAYYVQIITNDLVITNKVLKL